MKYTSLVVLSMLLAPQLFADSGQRLIPAGSLISCTTAEPKLSSKTTAIGDPVLCQVGHAERYGRSVLPLDSYLVGRFEDYKDPGHFVGKGWMELKFDRMVIEPNTVVPIDARVVDVPGYKVDNQGRILGKGHEARDIAMWSIPILWPIDLLMLPMRGPRPTLKEETRLTLKVMDDLAVPATDGPQRDPNGLYQRSPNAYAPEPPPPMQEPDSGQQDAYAQPVPPADEQPPAMAYAPPVAYPAPAPYYVPMPVAPYPAIIAYGGVVIGPRPGFYAYGPRAYLGGPIARAYAPGMRAYAYGYAGRGAVMRAGQYGRPGMAVRGGMAFGARVR